MDRGRSVTTFKVTVSLTFYIICANIMPQSTLDCLPFDIWRHMNIRRIAVPAGVALVLGLPIRRQLTGGVVLAGQRWKTNPSGASTDIVLSLVGQAFFWTVGQDFIGVGMDRKWGPGLGHRIAPAIQRRLPESASVAWGLKVIEIASDATKMPIEGYLYREIGIVPDAVAAAVTQPLWSFIEVVEKITGCINHPERVNEPNQVADSISSIYGTWSRNALSLAFLRYGRAYRSKAGNPIERVLTHVLPAGNG